ncbi:MAG: NACHT domain-containing protein [Chloroflexi bacterium]|nr:NACHT domain-containing protein [Chloroflexota bacterium]
MLLAALALLAIYGLLLVLSKIKKLLAEEFLPLFYDQEEKRRRNRRLRFADHVESEIRRLNNLEVWSDYRFAELEAEVEAEGRRQAFGLFPFAPRTQSGLRRERSLSKALESSQERLILLEGEPGSGKSVALRHVTQVMARRAMKARSAKTVIPIYINLKELARQPGQAVDRNLIHAFILKSLNRVNDRDIEEFLEEEFERGLREGTWLFLFDSFDELPEVLSSTEADQAIRSYAGAIADFLHGMNQCRGIVASRQFRGPGQVGWPRFRILPLSEERRLELVHKAELKPELEKDLVGQLGVTSHKVRSMASNPLFLGLLCEHVQTGNPFPENAHSVFETYIGTRLTRDEKRLWERFKLEPKEVRAAAESLAFCMAADPGLGLGPTRRDLEDATARLGLTVGERFDALLDALEYIKLARTETATTPGESKPFTFAHRRFQEYFSTCVVLREPERVSPRQLLTDARWRETAVVMCQTQPLEVLLPVLEEARGLLAEIVNNTLDLIEDPLEYVRVLESEQEDVEKEKLPPKPFSWPSGVLHILGLLQSGFGSRLEELPDDIRLCAGRLVLSASSTGTLSDRKWGLEVAGTIPQSILLWLLRDAFASGSQWLKEVAYQQVTRLGEIPDDIASEIRRTLVDLFANRRLGREQLATRAHLARLDEPAAFDSVLKLLLLLPFVDFVLHIAGFIVALVLFVQNTSLSLPILLVCLMLAAFFLSSHLCLWWLLHFRLSSEFLDFLKGAIAVVIRLGLGLWVLSILLLPITPSQLVSEFSYRYTLWVIAFANIYPGSALVWIFTLLTLWALFALLSARTGQFTHPLWWPLMPIWPILYFVRYAKKLTFATFVFLRESWKSVLLWGIVIVAFWLAFLLLFIPICIFLLGKSLSWSNDWVRWRRWVQSHRSPITSQGLFELFSQYHTASFFAPLVRTIQEQGLLVVAKDTEDMLEKLAIVIEHAIFVKKKRAKAYNKRPDLAIKRAINGLGMHLKKKKAENSSSRQTGDTLTELDSLELWLTQYAKGDEQRLSNLGPEFLDEICKLLEQVRASKQTQTAKDP